MDYIIYKKTGWDDKSWYMVGRTHTQAEAVAKADAEVELWRNHGMKAPCHKVCYNGRTSEEVYRNNGDQNP